jgi:cell division septation protein DedD
MAANKKGRNQGLYYFTRGQLAGLAAGFVVTSVVIFFLGILIGQGLEERKLLKQEEPLVKIPAQPLSVKPGSASAAPLKEEMTFYDTLTNGPARSEPAGEKLVKEVKQVERTVKPSIKETKAIPREEIARPSEKVKAGAAKEPLALEVRKEPLPQKSVEPEAKTGTEAQERAWAVQVNAFPHERDAANLAKKLTDKGYDAYVVTTSVKGKTWYRVRVGRLATREDARELQEDLQTKEKFTNSITVSR